MKPPFMKHLTSQIKAGKVGDDWKWRGRHKMKGKKTTEGKNNCENSKIQDIM